MLYTQFFKCTVYTFNKTKLGEQYLFIRILCQAHLSNNSCECEVPYCMFEKYFIRNKWNLNLVLLFLFMLYRQNKNKKFYYTHIIEWGCHYLCLRWLVCMWSIFVNCATKDKDKSSARHPSSWQPRRQSANSLYEYTSSCTLIAFMGAHFFLQIHPHTTW